MNDLQPAGYRTILMRAAALAPDVIVALLKRRKDVRLDPNPHEKWDDLAHAAALQQALTGMVLIWERPVEPPECYVIPTAHAVPHPGTPEHPGGYWTVNTPPDRGVIIDASEFLKLPCPPGPDAVE